MTIEDEVELKEIGRRAKAVRFHLDLTLDVISKELGMSRSYLSDFERGIRLPTSKYLKYLHQRHNVNLNYIFGSGLPLFRTEDNSAPYFGHYQPDIDELLWIMKDIPHAFHHVLGYIEGYKMEHQRLIEEAKMKRKEKDKPELPSE
ncbi:MAG: helix-turn-helix transcriptional regulator [bacterium]|nr:helix-turn-helix transcriptional regulator [bacterium]